MSRKKTTYFDFLWEVGWYSDLSDVLDDVADCGRSDKILLEALPAINKLVSAP